MLPWAPGSACIHAAPLCRSVLCSRNAVCGTIQGSTFLTNSFGRHTLCTGPRGYPPECFTDHSERHNCFKSNKEGHRHLAVAASPRLSHSQHFDGPAAVHPGPDRLLPPKNSLLRNAAPPWQVCWAGVQPPRPLCPACGPGFGCCLCSWGSMKRCIGRSHGCQHTHCMGSRRRPTRLLTQAVSLPLPAPQLQACTALCCCSC